MELVKNSNAVLDSIAKIRSLNKGYLTNFYPDFNKIQSWIGDKRLYKVEGNNSIFYLRKQDAFHYLFYISSNAETLGPDIEDLLPKITYPLVVEIISQKEEEEDVITVFKSKKFEPYANLVRLSRRTPENLDPNYPENIRKATSNDLQYLNDKLQDEFDEYSEQLPSLKELESLIQKGFVLLYQTEGEIAGFVILEINGLTQHFRYWFVDPKYRNMKVGSALYNAFLISGKETKRLILWCRTDNENALKRHEHYGYTKENMYDHILIKTKL